MSLSKRLLIVLGLALATVLMGSQLPLLSQTPQRVIYFAAIAPEGSEFWGKIRLGAEDAAKHTGLRMIWTSGPSVISVEETVNRMETAIATNPGVLVVSIIDPAAMLPVVRRAVQRGITVFNINTSSRSADPPYVLYVGTDERLAGRAAGEAVLAASPTPPRRAACATHVPGHVGLEDRCRGFTDVLRPRGTVIDIVDVRGGPTEAEEKMRAYFTARKDADAVYTMAASPAVFDPVLKVLKAERLIPRVKLVASDTSVAALEAVKAGEAVAAIDQQPYLQGYLPVIYADLYLKYQMLPGGLRQVLTGPLTIKKENADAVIGLIKQKIR